MTKTFSHYPAFPADERIHDMDSCGLTKREYFAAMAMQGFLSQSHTPADPNTEWTAMGFGIGEDVWNSLNRHEKHVAATTADFSVQMADALIDALNKQEAK